MANANRNPMQLLGHTIKFRELIAGQYEPVDSRIVARVVSVVIPLPNSDFGYQLLLQHLDCGVLEFIKLDELDFEWPLMVA